MQSQLRRHIRAEWAGFDTICREEIGLDAWTLIKGYKVPKELIAELQGLLSADAGGGNRECHNGRTVMIEPVDHDDGRYGYGRSATRKVYSSSVPNAARASALRRRR